MSSTTFPSAAMTTRTFGIVDYVLFATSLATAASIGIFHAIRGRNKATTEEFLMGGRNFKVLPLTISLAVSVISAVTILGLPAEIYTQGTQYFFNIGSGLGIILTAFIFVPLLHPLKLTSMFEYLERRFDSRAVRLTGSVIEICSLVLYGGAALYAPAVALTGVTHLSMWKFAVLLGTLVTFYTSLGGMKTVIWNDVVQLVIMSVGIVTIMIQGCMAAGGMAEVFKLSKQGNRMQFYNMDPDPSTRHTFWGLSIGFAFGSLSFYGASQFTFQRYAAVKTLTQAKMTVLLNLPLFYAFHVILCFIGLIIYAYYTKIGCDPLESGSIMSSNQLLPLFVMDTLGDIPGLAGLFVAALTSGALSTLSSVINSVATLLWDDILKNKCSRLSDKMATVASKITVAITGLLIIGLSFIAQAFGPHIFQVCFALLGATGGPQLGLFLLGALVPWANWKGALAGCLAGSLLSAWITIGTFITKPFSAPLPPAPSDNCLLSISSASVLFSNGQMLNTFYTANTTSAVISRAAINYGDLLTTSAPPFGSSSVVSGVSRLYTLSYTWYSLLGVVTCLIVGCLVSLITGMNEHHPDSQLILCWWKIFNPICKRLKRCCGINPDTELAISNMYTIEYRSDDADAEVTLMNGVRKEPEAI